MDTMKVSISAVIFYIVFEITLCVARYQFINNTNMIEDNFEIPCNTAQQCEETGFKGFTCIDNICSCEDSKMCHKSKLKTTVTKIGQNCMESSECFIEQSICNEGKCECIESTVSSKNKRTCLNVSGTIGSSCEEDVQCVLLNGVCENKKCACSHNTHLDKGICFKTVELGFPCQRNEECSNTPFSSCKFNKCVCDKKYVKSEAHSKCLLKSRHIFSICSENIQCRSVMGSGSACWNGFCACMEVFQYKARINKCVTDAFLGEICGNHSDCHQPGGGESRLECIIGVCKCKPEYFQNGGFCLLNSAKSGTSFSFRDVLPYVISYVFCYLIV